MGCGHASGCLCRGGRRCRAAGCGGVVDAGDAHYCLVRVESGAGSARSAVRGAVDVGSVVGAGSLACSDRGQLWREVCPRKGCRRGVRRRADYRQKATGGKSPGTAMRAVARARHQNRRFSARVPGNELLPLMVPVALANVADSESCSRAALAVTSLLSASPQVALLDLAYAELLRHTLEAAAKGVNWRDSIDWDRAVDTSVQMAGDALAGWTVVDGEPPFSVRKAHCLRMKVLRSIRDPRESGESSDAGLVRHGAGLTRCPRWIACWLLLMRRAGNCSGSVFESCPRGRGVSCAFGEIRTRLPLSWGTTGRACGPTAVPSDWVESIWGWPLAPRRSS